MLPSDKCLYEWVTNMEFIHVQHSHVNRPNLLWERRCFLPDTFSLISPPATGLNYHESILTSDRSADKETLTPPCQRHVQPWAGLTEFGTGSTNHWWYTPTHRFTGSRHHNAGVKQMCVSVCARPAPARQSGKEKKNGSLQDHQS